jgi:aspartate/methionine/tyrosine aminotransferase
LSRYIEDSIADGFASVRDVISVNRASVRLAVSGTMLELIDPVVDTSVAWCRINDPEVDAETLQQRLLTHEVYVLPGTYFYWNNPSRGSRYIRLALARQPREFRAAMTAMREVLTSNEN